MTIHITRDNAEDLQDYIIVLLTDIFYGISLMLEGLVVVCSFGTTRPNIIGPVSSKIINFRWKHINKPFGKVN